MTSGEYIDGTDPAGLQTLEHFAQAKQFNRWLFTTIQPYCKGHVLEVGSGIGNLSRLFLEKKMTLTASDLREEYCTLLQQKFGAGPHLQRVIPIDLAVTDFETRHASLLQRFDTVVALNVVEHIADAALAVNNCKLLLKPGGHLVILVPAYRFLYNLFDKELGHFVRYTRKTLKALLVKQQLELIHTEYFNAVGILGWIMNGSILRKRMIPSTQLQLFDKLVPVIKLIDTLTFHSIGLSVIAVARKIS